MNIMFNHITQSGMAEITGVMLENIASHMPPDMKNFGRKQVPKKGNKATK